MNKKDVLKACKVKEKEFNNCLKKFKKFDGTAKVTLKPEDIVDTACCKMNLPMIILQTCKTTS